MENYVEKINWEKYKKPIVIEKSIFNTVPETYLYRKELNVVKDILERFDNENGAKNEAISRNITIAGERGSGKTSFLKSLKNILSDDYYVFDIVGSEILSFNMTIIDVFLSKLDVLINIIYKDNQENCIKLSELKGLLKKAMAAIGVEKQEKEYFKNGQPENAMLQALSDRLRLEGIFAEILDCLKGILEFQGKTVKDFILIIDDLDLVKNSLISQFLTEIQRYLDKKLIIIFAYRERQLENSLFEDRFNDNKNLIGQNIIESDEIYSQIEQFLVKLVPYGNRINLFKQDDVLNLKISDVLASLESSEKKCYGLDNNLHITLQDESCSNSKTGLTVEDWFYKYIHRHTDLYIKPVDTREDTHQFLPRSLRELIQCFEMFDRMKPLGTIDDKDFSENILSNIEILKRYKFFKVSIQFASNSSILDYFNEWEVSKPFHKNMLTYHFFNRSFPLEGYSNILYKRANYNITLGDVLECIDAEKHQKNIVNSRLENYFFYIVKLSYSIDLSFNFFKSYERLKELVKDKEDVIEKFKIKREAYYTNNDSNEDNNESNNQKERSEDFEKAITDIYKAVPELEVFLQLINCDFMPRSFNYFDYTKYERDDSDYILDFRKKLNTNDKESTNDSETFNYFINNFINSEISALGDVRRNIERGFSQFVYRRLYTFNPIYLDQQAKYYLSFYISCNKGDYVINKIINLIEKRIEQVPYFFKNVFQVDIFIRQNYTSRTPSNRFITTFTKINDTVSGEKGLLNFDYDDNTMKTYMVNDEKNVGFPVNFAPLYPLDDKEFYSNYYNDLVDNSEKNNKKKNNKNKKDSEKLYGSRFRSVPKAVAYLNSKTDGKIKTVVTNYKRFEQRLKKDFEFLESGEKQQFDVILKHISFEKKLLVSDFDKLAEFYNKYLK